MTLEKIKNVRPSMAGAPATAGQPTERQLGALAKTGFQVVINLGLANASYSLPDEAGLVASLGMTYHHLPVAFDEPTLEDLRRFIALMDRHTGERIFVHCAANYRVSSFVALYGEARLGWSRAEADAYIERVWHPDPVWTAFLAAARQKMLG